MEHGRPAHICAWLARRLAQSQIILVLNERTNDPKSCAIGREGDPWQLNKVSRLEQSRKSYQNIGLYTKIETNKRKF